MRASYLSHDRSDLQFAVKRLAQNMANPTKKDWQRLKRLGRYMLGCKRVVYHYRWQTRNNVLTLNTDSDFAGDKGTRKSTSGGVLRIGTHFLKSWSKGQSLIALSSAEAELYAIGAQACAKCKHPGGSTHSNRNLFLKDFLSFQGGY